MYNYRLAVVVISIVTCSVFIKGGDSLSCYVCSSDTTGAGVGTDTNGCGALVGAALNLKNNTCVSCSTTAPTNGESIIMALTCK